MKGQIIKAHSSNFVVECEKQLYNCTARGLLKRGEDGLVCGDYVEFDGKVITSICDRKNKFIRPSVSNVDVVIIVVSPTPKPDFHLIDKVVINAVKEDVEIVFVVNKTDVDDNLYDFICSEYMHCSNMFFRVSAKDKKGIIDLKSYLKNKVCVLSGQSAVGKTSLVNAMFDLSLKTGELSEKILRGRHTTTYSELHAYEDIKIIDSPGFAVIDADVDIEVLPECYPEYFNIQSGCKFRGCAHVSEPNCAVKKAVLDGVLSKTRYERYLDIYNELKSKRGLYE